MYLVPEKTGADKEKNRETMRIADAIRSKFVVELRNGQYGFKSQISGNVLFYDYYRAMCEKRLGTESRGNWGNWYSCLLHLKNAIAGKPSILPTSRPNGYRVSKTISKIMPWRGARSTQAHQRQTACPKLQTFLFQQASSLYDPSA